MKTSFIYTNPDETLAVTRVVAVRDGMELIYTNLPGVVVKCQSFGEHDELREILLVTEAPAELVESHGPSITYVNGVTKITWSSGSATDDATMAREIAIMRLAQWMAQEMLALHGAIA